jgi:hypothetical protein
MCSLTAFSYSARAELSAGMLLFTASSLADCKSGIAVHYLSKVIFPLSVLRCSNALIRVMV